MKYALASTLIFLSFGIHAAESRLELRHREAKGVGYDKGYTSVDYLFLHQWGKPEFLFNLRGHVFNDGHLAGNVGIGYRHGIRDNAYMLGINTFYDCRESQHLFTSQIGAGLEFLSKSIDLRANGYLPLADKTYEKRRFQQFVGNQIVIEQKAIGALPSAEVELGMRLTRAFYLAAGPYYLFKETVRGVHLGGSWGSRVRLDVNIDNHFTLGGVVTHDQIFNTTIQGFISFNIPLGGGAKKITSKRVLKDVPIFRNEIIPLEKKKRDTPLYLGEDESQLVDILFVDNLAPAGGNGSIQAPFSSLKAAEAASEPGDVIYVFPGDGTPRNMEEGIVLKEDQVIASSGAPLELEEISIPPMTPGEHPIITNIHPDELVIVNPGSSNLADFRIIEPWEYFFGDWNFFLGNNNEPNIDSGINLGVSSSSPHLVGERDSFSDTGNEYQIIVAPSEYQSQGTTPYDAPIVAPSDQVENEHAQAYDPVIVAPDGSGDGSSWQDVGKGCSDFSSPVQVIWVPAGDPEGVFKIFDLGGGPIKDDD